MISAKYALGTINKEVGMDSDFKKLCQVNKMIKAAKTLGQDKVILTYMTNEIMDELYDKGYRIYKIHGMIRDKMVGDPDIENIERITMYVVQWKHANEKSEVLNGYREL